MNLCLSRRFFLGVGIVRGLTARSWARAAGEPIKTFRVGFPVLQPRSAPPYRAFEERLRELGYEDGRNLRVDFVQISPGHPDDYFPVIAAMIDRGADVIVAGGPEIALKSAVAASRTVPIVMVAIDYDPLAHGYIATLARPGGNVTGVFLQQIELTLKRLELLTLAFPEMRRVVALWDQISADQFKAAREAARSLKHPLDGRRCANPPYDYEAVLAGADGRKGDALLQMTSPYFFHDRDRIAMTALGHDLPSMFSFREWVDAGGLISYGASVTNMYRIAADYVARILRGAVAADLPVEQPTRFELVINLKTAKTLGITVPQSLLARADQVIE